MAFSQELYEALKSSDQKCRTITTMEGKIINVDAPISVFCSVYRLVRAEEFSIIDEIEFDALSDEVKEKICELLSIENDREIGEDEAQSLLNDMDGKVAQIYAGICKEVIDAFNLGEYYSAIDDAWEQVEGKDDIDHIIVGIIPRISANIHEYNDKNERFVKFKISPAAVLFLGDLRIDEALRHAQRGVGALLKNLDNEAFEVGFEEFGAEVDRHANRDFDNDCYNGLSESIMDRLDKIDWAPILGDKLVSDSSIGRFDHPNQTFLNFDDDKKCAGCGGSISIFDLPDGTGSIYCKRCLEDES